MSADSTTGDGTRPPSGCTDFTVADADSALEQLIRAAHARLLDVPWDERTAAWEEFSALVRRRSVNQVRFMERVRGLT